MEGAASMTSESDVIPIIPAKRTPLLALGGVLVVSEFLYVALLRLDAVNGVRPVLTFLALMGALFALYAAGYFIVRRTGGDSRLILLVVIVGAVLFRLTLLPAGLPHDASPRELIDAVRADVRGERVAYDHYLLFDNDIWRYVWDGHVQAHGINPYMHAPDAAALDKLVDEDAAAQTDNRAVWSDIRDQINHPSTSTIYPPLAQIVFRFSHWLAPGSIFIFKSILVGFDLLAALFILLTLRALGRSPLLVLLYAWNPLVVKVFAASGHADAVLVAMVAATTFFIARGSRRLAAVSFALAILAKLSPFILFPFVARRIGWRNSALIFVVMCIGYIPFLDAGSKLFDGFRAFATGWQFNAGTFSFLHWSASAVTDESAFVARAASGILIFGFVGLLAWRDDGSDASFAGYAAAALGTLVLLSPTVMPWYIAWVLPLAVVSEQRIWFYFTAVVCLAFLVMIDGIERPLTLWVEYALFGGLLWYELRCGNLPSALNNTGKRLFFSSIFTQPTDTVRHVSKAVKVHDEATPQRKASFV